MIQAKIKITEHKLVENVQRGYYCYWHVPVLPSAENLSKIRNVCFTDGNKIYAEGKFLMANHDRDGKKIHFEPLHTVNRPLPRPPASRGWCYINKDGIEAVNAPIQLLGSGQDYYVDIPFTYEYRVLGVYPITINDKQVSAEIKRIDNDLNKGITRIWFKWRSICSALMLNTQ